MSVLLLVWLKRRKGNWVVVSQHKMSALGLLFGGLELTLPAKDHVNLQMNDCCTIYFLFMIYVSVSGAFMYF